MYIALNILMNVCAFELRWHESVPFIALYIVYVLHTSHPIALYRNAFCIFANCNAYFLIECIDNEQTGFLKMGRSIHSYDQHTWRNVSNCKRCTFTPNYENASYCRIVAAVNSTTRKLQAQAQMLIL